MKINELNSYLLKILNPENIEFSDENANSLQIKGKEDVQKIAFGVDASVEFFRLAKEWGADALVTHHGIRFSHVKKSIPSTVLHNRLKFLFQNDISLFAFHFLLDYHPELGNNAQILKELGLDPQFKFGKFEGDFWGLGTNLEKEVSLEEIFEKTSKIFKNNSQMYSFRSNKINSIAVVSGGGYITINELVDKKIDLLITGEVVEPTQEFCRELGINLIFGGHYITETFGVKALAEKVKSDLGLETKFIEVLNLS